MTILLLKVYIVLKLSCFENVSEGECHSYMYNGSTSYRYRSLTKRNLSVSYGSMCLN